MKWNDQPTQLIHVGSNGHLCETAGGHPEGYIEAFANIYRDFVYKPDSITSCQNLNKIRYFTAKGPVDFKICGA